MPQAFPEEFRRDVVAVAQRKQAPLSQIAKDFGISESCLHRWVKRAEIEDGVREGLTLAEEAEIRELKKRNRLKGTETHDPHHATSSYSWMRPPRTPRPRTRSMLGASAWGSGSESGARRSIPGAPLGVVVGDVVAERPVEMTPTEDERPVKAFTSDGAEPIVRRRRSLSERGPG